MKLRCVVALLLVWWTPALFGRMLFGQAGRSAAGERGSRSIRGVVVSSTTGRPIDGATVSLRDSEDNSSSMETSTDSEGRFAFGQLPDGRFALRASHRGYIAAGLEEHEGFFTAVVTGAVLDTANIRFPLEPQGSIYGTVMEDSGDPVPHGSVSLYRKDNRTGVDKMVRAGTQNTDDLGHYEFPRLSPGNYYIAVSGKPWYATHLQPRMSSSGSRVELPRSPLDVAYATTYYSDVTDSDAATGIPVKAGDHIPINFALHPVPAVQITVNLPKDEPGGGVRMPHLHQDVFGSEQYSSGGAFFMMNPPREDGGTTATVTITGLAPGHYLMDSWKPGGERDREYSVDASSDTAVLHVGDAGASSVDVAGQVAMADGDSLPSGLSISLGPIHGEVPVSARPDAQGSFQLRGVLPGEYEIHLAAAGQAVAATRISATGATLSGNVLKVGSAPVMMAAILASGRNSVKGYAELDGKRSAGAMMVLVPKDTEAKDLYRRDQTNSDGSFLFRRVIPGEYTVVAIEDGWGLEWARPEVIARYLAVGTKVKVSAGSDLDLKEPVALQMK